MEVTTTKLWEGFSRKLLYEDDLILMAETEDSLCEKTVKWKSDTEVKSVKMNTGKMKAMFSCTRTDTVEEKSKWPCSVCKKGAGK